MNLRRDVVILACAVSAGIHGALAPEHFEEAVGAGIGFVVSTILLAALAIVLTTRPASSVPLAWAAIVFAGLLVSYAVETTVGFPLLHPQPEPATPKGGPLQDRSASSGADAQPGVRHEARQGCGREAFRRWT